jgi:hypothetical protein
LELVVSKEEAIEVDEEEDASSRLSPSGLPECAALA